MTAKRIGIIVATMVIAIIVIGEVYIYTFSADGTYDITSSEESDGIHYTVSSKISNDYDVVLFDNGDFVQATEYYIVDDDSYVISGDSGNVKQIIQQLKKRGVELKTVTATSLKDIMSDNLSSDKCQCLIAVGTLPDTVYSGQASDILFKWIDHGGRLYWVNTAIGSYYSTSDSLKQVQNNSELFFGTDCISTGDRLSDKLIGNNETNALKLCNSEMKDSIVVDKLKTGTEYLAVGYSENGCSSDTLIRYGNGMVCSISGYFNDYQSFDLAQIISSGLCYKTKVIGHSAGSLFRSTVSGVIQCDCSDLKNMTLYTYIGGYFLEYARCKAYCGTA